MQHHSGLAEILAGVLQLADRDTGQQLGDGAFNLQLGDDSSAQPHKAREQGNGNQGTQ
ncbi:hypothetical protein D3C73_1448030 [compost metagenome]